MPSKRYDKPCCYCGQPGGTKDHILARSFLPVRYRGQIRCVPACQPCNKRKSDLEAYVRTMMPVGSMMDSELSSEIFETLVKPTVEKDASFRRRYQNDMRRLLIPREDGTIGPDCWQAGLDFDMDKLKELCGMIAQALSYFYFDVTITPNRCDIEVAFPRNDSEHALAMHELFEHRAGNTAEGNWGEGIFRFRGSHVVSGSLGTIWAFSLYHAMAISDEDTRSVADIVYVITSPKSNAPEPD